MNDAQIPLCVQLEGALTTVNTVHEKLLAILKRSPRTILHTLGRLRHGRRAFWRNVVAAGRIDVDTLPLNHKLLEWLRDQHGQGRRLILVAERDAPTAMGLAGCLNVFHEVASSETECAAPMPAGQGILERRYGAGNFDFVGSGLHSGAIAKGARRAIFVDALPHNRSGANAVEICAGLATEHPSLATWIKALRLYQWVKNALIFVPAVLAHTIVQMDVLFSCVLAFFAFGLCASSVYILNDLFDLSSDRRHPRKRYRPFASGMLSARSGLMASVLLLCAALAIAPMVNAQFLEVLVGYYVLTMSYSVYLKRIGMIDVMTLAGLYTVRVIAGAAAATVPLSFWLLAFSIFTFVSLGFVKRYAELNTVRRSGVESRSGRGYSEHDLMLIMSLGTSAGYIAVVVMALYLNSVDSTALYQRHRILWLVCPLMLYWISRIWTQTSRGLMHDDPIVFALRDRVSLIVFALVVFVVSAAV